MTPILKWRYWWSRVRVKLIDECTVTMYMPGKSYWGHVSPINTYATFVDNGESILPSTSIAHSDKIPTAYPVFSRSTVPSALQ